jgi:hypothetical protein
MPRVGFEPTIPAFERAKTVHASDRAATVMGNHLNIQRYIASVIEGAVKYATDKRTADSNYLPVVYT